MTTEICPECGVPGGGDCSSCHGSGMIQADEVSFSGPSGSVTACPACGGSGECQKCGGAGEIEVGGEG